MANDDEYVTMREAQDILGVSNFTIWRMVREGELPAYQLATDRRKKLVKRSDLAALKQPKPITVGEPRKPRPEVAGAPLASFSAAVSRAEERVDGSTKASTA